MKQTIDDKIGDGSIKKFREMPQNFTASTMSERPKNACVPISVNNELVFFNGVITVEQMKSLCRKTNGGFLVCCFLCLVPGLVLVFCLS